MESKLKATDLMIGDWVTDQYYDIIKKHIKVDSINEKGINLFVEDDGNWSEIAQTWVGCEYKFKDLRGIPLTPELLEKCGFVKKKVQFMLNVGGESTTYFEHEKGFIIWYHGPRLGYSLNKVIRNTINPECLVFNSLHQLQQLIRLITKQELIINL